MGATKVGVTKLGCHKKWAVTKVGVTKVGVTKVGVTKVGVTKVGGATGSMGCETCVKTCLLLNLPAEMLEEGRVQIRAHRLERALQLVRPNLGRVEHAVELLTVAHLLRLRRAQRLMIMRMLMRVLILTRGGGGGGGGIPPSWRHANRRVVSKRSHGGARG